MINLLPPKEKKRLAQQKTHTLVMVLGCAVMLGIICLILVLLSVRFSILQEIAYQKGLLAGVEEKYQTPDFLSLKDAIGTYNKELVRTDVFYKNQTVITDTLLALLATPRSQGITFTSLSLEKKPENDQVTVALGGYSKTREELVEFKEYLLKNQALEKVVFPPDSWVKPRNIEFNLTFLVSKP